VGYFTITQTVARDIQTHSAVVVSPVRRSRRSAPQETIRGLRKWKLADKRLKIQCRLLANILTVKGNDRFLFFLFGAFWQRDEFDRRADLGDLQNKELHRVLFSFDG